MAELPTHMYTRGEFWTWVAVAGFGGLLVGAFGFELLGGALSG